MAVSFIGGGNRRRQSVLLVEETGENHRPSKGHCQTL